MKLPEFQGSNVKDPFELQKCNENLINSNEQKNEIIDSPSFTALSNVKLIDTVLTVPEETCSPKT